MKKLVGVVLAVSMILSLGACGSGEQAAAPAPAPETGTEEPAEVAETPNTGDVIKMKLANPNPVGDVKDLAAIRFSELVYEKTNGQVEITVYSGGQLGDARDTIEGLALGTNEIVIESVGTTDAYTSLASIDAVPYMYADYDHYERVMFGELGAQIREEVGEAGGFKLLGAMYRGARVCTTKKLFNTPDELKGLKVRVPNQQIYIDTWTVLGASPTPLALTETFTALQQNTVEAQENATIESYGFGFYDVCDYLVKTNHVYSTDVFIFDRDYFNALPADIQAALEEAAMEASEYRNEISLTQEAEYEELFKEKGVEVVEIDVQPFMDRCDGFVDEYYPELADWAKSIAELK